MNLKVRDKSAIKGTCWIELNLSGSATSYDHWLTTSRYLDVESFSFFFDIFQRHAVQFNYYGPTFYSTEQLLAIRQEVEARARELDQLSSLSDLRKYVRQHWWMDDLKQGLKRNYPLIKGRNAQLIRQVKRLGSDLSQVLEEGIRTQSPLWVLGI